MTFVLVAAFGLGVILIQSAVENVSISQTIRDIMSGKLGLKSTNAATGATGVGGTFSMPVPTTPPPTTPNAQAL